MSIINVTNASQLQSALKSAQAGDTISLAAGNYGDVSISNAFSSAVTIQSASASNPAVFNSLKLSGASNINFDNVDVKLAPTATSTYEAPVVNIANSKNIHFTGGVVESGPAIDGVSQSASATDSTGNVKGLPQGVGFQLMHDSGITITGTTLTELDKGVTMLDVSGSTISHNTITNLRQSGIDGAELTNITIDSNSISNSHPWGWGSTPEKDHADFIHLWTQAGTTTGNSGVTITNNVLNQGNLTGLGILGIFLEDNNGKGWTNTVVSNNAIIDNQWQGIYVENMHNSTLNGNTLVQSQGAYNGQPALVFAAGSSGNTVNNNITAHVETNTGGSVTPANSASGNITIQNTSSSGANYLSEASVAAFDTSSAAEIRSEVLAKLGLSGGSTPPSGGSGSTPPSGGSGSTPPSGGSGSTPPSGGSGSTPPSGGSGNGVSGTAATISAELDQLAANPPTSSVVITDNAALSVTAAQVTKDAAVLAKVVDANGSAYSLHVTDTAANVSAALSKLVANGHVGSITLSDHAAVTVPASQSTADSGVLSKIAGDHLVTYTGYTGQAYSSVTIDVNAQGIWASKTLNNNDGTHTITGNVAGLTFASSTHAQTITVTSPHDTFVMDQGFGPEVVHGYQPGNDVLSFNHLLFSSAASVLAAAKSDGHGGTLITASAGHTLDLAGVTLAQLQQHTSDFHFF